MAERVSVQKFGFILFCKCLESHTLAYPQIYPRIDAEFQRLRAHGGEQTGPRSSGITQTPIARLDGTDRVLCVSRIQILPVHLGLWWSARL